MIDFNVLSHGKSEEGLIEIKLNRFDYDPDYKINDKQGKERAEEIIVFLKDVLALEVYEALEKKIYDSHKKRVDFRILLGMK